MEYPYQLSVLFTENEMKAIEQAADDHNMSKCEVIRLCIDNGLEIKREKA